MDNEKKNTGQETPTTNNINNTNDIPTVANTQPAAPLNENDLANLANLNPSDFTHTIPWTTNDYTPLGIVGPSAAKLYSSAVAPIVAAARGYTQFGYDDQLEARRKYNLPKWSTTQGRRLKASLEDGNVLIMPWYRVDVAVQYQSKKIQPEPTTIQYRPEKPRLHATKSGSKPRHAKYEFVVNSESVIDLHPSTPSEWLWTDEKGRSKSDTWLLAEGLLKADSALSALLIASDNITEQDLQVDNNNQLESIDRLTILMNRLEPHLRIPILCIGGVYNWKNNTEWNTLSFKDANVWIGIDGDVSTNRQVWMAANELWKLLEKRKKANVSLLSPIVTRDGGLTEKMGIDDYLKEIGPWSRLTNLLTNKLPDCPIDENHGTPGEWRVDASGCTVSECVEEKDPITGQVTGSKWVEKYPLGGRIAELSLRRYPTNREETTGILGEGLQDEDEDTYETEVRIEVQWSDENDVIHTAIIRGPHTILNYSPDKWDQKGAHIPGNLTLHPAWPPNSGKTSQSSWLGAVKSNRVEERSEPTRWARMGWVPTGGTGSIPSYIAGEQVISHRNQDKVTDPGVKESDLSGASKFGVGEPILPEKSFDDPEYTTHVNEDLNKIMKAFFDNQPWTNPAVPATILAGALRPALPLRPKGSIFIAGPPGKGKSYTAGVFMSFWSRKPGDWGGSRLSGSADDTKAAIELAVSRAPIWVIDDYAPKADAKAAQLLEDKITDILRAQFNLQSRNRTENAGQKAAKKHPPNAALLVTGENELNTSSVRQRLVRLEIRAGSLNPSREPTNKLTRLCDIDGAPARLSQHLIRFVQYKTAELGWQEIVSMTRDMMEDSVTEFQDKFENSLVTSSARAGELFAEYNIALRWLSLMAQEIGWTVRERRIFGTSDEGLGNHIIGMIGQSTQGEGEYTPGRALVRGLHTALQSGYAHIVNGTDPKLAPFHENNIESGIGLASTLGWNVTGDGDRPVRPSGVPIGYLVYKDGKPILLLNAEATFNVVQRNYPKIVPHGRNSSDSWQSAFDEGLLSDEFPSRNKRKKYIIRPRILGEVLANHVAIELGTLTSSGSTGLSGDNDNDEVADM